MILIYDRCDCKLKRWRCKARRRSDTYSPSDSDILKLYQLPRVFSALPVPIPVSASVSVSVPVSVPVSASVSITVTLSLHAVNDAVALPLDAAG